MSRYANDLVQRQRERMRSSEETRQRQEDDREAKKRSERSEQEFTARLLASRVLIGSVEDLRIDLQRRNLLVYVDLTRLKERERFLLNRLGSISNITEFDSSALRNEIVEYSRMYDEYSSGFHDKTAAAQLELSKKQNRLKEALQMASREISVLQRIIDELITDNSVNIWFSKTLNQYTAQLRDLAAILLRIKPDADILPNTFALLERLRKRVRRIRQNCNTIKERADKLDPRKDEPEDFLYMEPFYFRKPKERVPPRILAKVQALEKFSKT